MTKRTYIVISASLVICLFAVGLWCWSPQASIDKRLSIRDLLLLRLAARAHTFLPIYEIAVEGDDKASVIAGGVLAWVHIPKDYAWHGVGGNNIYTCYYFGLVSRNHGLIPALEAGLSCDTGLFP